MSVAMQCSKGDSIVCKTMSSSLLLTGVSLLAISGFRQPAVEPPSPPPPPSQAALASNAPPPLAAFYTQRDRFHFGTRSIAACDPTTGECGIAVVTFPTGAAVVVPVGEPGIAI